MPFGEHAAWFTFTSDRFDHSSELPPDASAGNRFYGRDVAELISARLEKQGIDASFFDEDWGWQVHGKRPDKAILEISIYHNPEEDPTKHNEWSLMLRLISRGRFRNKELPVDEAAITTLNDVFRQEGIELNQRPPEREGEIAISP